MNVCGPVDYRVIYFPEDKFDSSILPALNAVVEDEMIRVLDLVYIVVGQDGELNWTELQDLDDVPGLELAAVGALSEEDINDIAAGLPAGSASLIIVWENLWAVPLIKVIERAGGQLIAGAHIPRTVVESAFTELAV